MKDFSQSTDSELMVAYQQGENGAFMEIYKRYSPKIYGYLGKKLFNKSELDDLFQGVLLKFHKSKLRYNDKYPLEAWIFIITKSEFIDYCRKHKTKPVTTELAEQTTESYESETLLQALTEKNREVMKMRYIDEATFEEIAEKIHTSPTNVRKMVSCSLKFLKMKMGVDHE